ncbi:hypothetical protein IWQ61_004661 [Dispira simplex]|nr:hypothetical protein IWQ61_004661 [Dispira simplex]
MAFKLFIVVALATLMTVVTAELPSDVKDCLNKCMDNGNTNSCIAECVGTTLEVMDKLEKCGSNCWAESTSDRDAALVCIQGCVDEFDKESKYSYQDMVTAMDDIANDALDSENGTPSSDKSDVESANFQTNKNTTESTTKTATKASSTTSADGDDAVNNNGANDVATFMGSVGLSAAVIAYQFS